MKIYSFILMHKHFSKLVSKFTKKHPNLNAIVIATAVIIFWRGVWGLLDYYLLPDHPFLSHVVSIFIGLAILYFNDFKLTELK